MHRLIPLSAVMLCALLIGLGCGDDETTTITQYDTLTEYDTVTQTVTINDTSLPVIAAVGAVSPDNGLYFRTSMYYPTPDKPVPDSVTVADSLCLLNLAANWDVLGNINFYYIADYNTATLLVQPGDTAEIHYYVNGQLSTVRVKTLHPQFQQPLFVDSVIPDSVFVDDPITLTWSKCTPADWYRLEIDYWTGGGHTIKFWVAVFDTTYTISGDLNTEDATCNILVTAVTGPEPGNRDGNITGGLVRGTILSYTLIDGVSVRIGTGALLRTAGKVSSELPTLEQIGDDLVTTYHLTTPAKKR